MDDSTTDETEETPNPSPDTTEESQTQETPEESTEDDNPFPEGSKEAAAFIRERKKRQDAEVLSAADRVRMQNIEQMLQKLTPAEQKQVKQEMEASDVEVKVVAAAMKKLGLDPNALREDAVKATRTIQLQAATDRLRTKYADSVPFDAEAVIKHAADNGYGLAMPNASIEKALELAYKDMNMDKIMEWKAQKGQKKKVAPTKIESGGTGQKPTAPNSDAPKSFQDFKKQAMART